MDKVNDGFFHPNKSERGEAILWRKETKKLKYRERGKKSEGEKEESE